MSYTLTLEPTFLRIALQGAITQQELYTFAQELVATETASALAPHRLLDLSAMSAPYLTYPDLHAFAKHRKMQPLANPVKLAILAPRPIHLGFARMYQTLNDRPQITTEIFATVEDTGAWLLAE